MLAKPNPARTDAPPCTAASDLVLAVCRAVLIVALCRIVSVGEAVAVMRAVPIRHVVGGGGALALLPLDLANTVKERQHRHVYPRVVVHRVVELHERLAARQPCEFVSIIACLLSIFCSKRSLTIRPHGVA